MQADLFVTLPFHGPGSLRDPCQQPRQRLAQQADNLVKVAPQFFRQLAANALRVIALVHQLPDAERCHARYQGMHALVLIALEFQPQAVRKADDIAFLRAGQRSGMVDQRRHGGKFTGLRHAQAELCADIGQHRRLQFHTLRGIGRQHHQRGHIVADNDAVFRIDRFGKIGGAGRQLREIERRQTRLRPQRLI